MDHRRPANSGRESGNGVPTNHFGEIALFPSLAGVQCNPIRFDSSET